MDLSQDRQLLDLMKEKGFNGVELSGPAQDKFLLSIH
jgi:hypothetical protein